MGIQPPGPPPPRAAGATTARAPGAPDLAEAEVAVTALYQVHALGLVRLAHVMLGDRAAAEDIVQEAFGGLYRRWAHVLDNDRALQYLRSSVLNGCRSALRRRRFADAENRQGFVFLIPELAQDDGLRFVPSG